MGVEAERRETEINQCLRLSVFYDVLFRPSLIPSADALKEHGLETGGACVGKYARSLWRGRFSMQVSSVSDEARATFASAVGMSKRAATIFS